jgi:hypothetical protein
MISLVVPLAVVHFPLSLPHSCERILLLRHSVVVVCLQGALFFEKVLVDLLEGFLLGENSTPVRL